MTMPEISCKAVAIQNSSQWPCSMCLIPQLRLVGVRTFSNIFLYFLDTLSSGPHYKYLFGAPLLAAPVTSSINHTTKSHPSCRSQNIIFL